MYLHQLIVQVWQQQNCDNTNYSTSPLSQVNNTRGFYFNTKSQKVEQYCVNNEGVDTAKTELMMLLSVYAQGQKQATMHDQIRKVRKILRKFRQRSIYFYSDFPVRSIFVICQNKTMSRN